MSYRWKENATIMSREIHSIVFIPDENAYGEIISEGLFASLIRYTVGGVMYEVILLNEDFDIVQEIALEIEEEY